MRVCLILEGSYPYVHGGVSTWMHEYLQAMPDYEFVLWVIGAKEEDKGKFVYELPANVVEVHEVFLDSALRLKGDAGRKVRFTQEEEAAADKLMNCDKPDWDVLFRLFQEKKVNPVNFLMSEAFLNVLRELCKAEYPYVAYAQAFHTIRSMLLPVFYLCEQKVPEADYYHAICTGYAGLLGGLAVYKTGKKLLLTEHGIYSREREEEIIRAQWVIPDFKRHWIKFFYMLSDLAYKRATTVTSLFLNASKTQIDLGADASKCRVISNGIHYEKFCDIPLKKEDGIVDIGAVIRFAPIKDVKTLLYAFYELSQRNPNVRLHVLGGIDDEEYYDECVEIKENLNLQNVIFTGRVDVTKYMEKLDVTILTSLSEGQPLSVLESFAARRPCVTTDVGCCKELLDGASGDYLGTAGFIAPPMDRTGLANALERLCESREKRIAMGEIGQKRVEKNYKHATMMNKYREMYKEVQHHALYDTAL